MKSEKEDRRVRYTKMVLEQSLLDIMKEKPINKITVTDICKLADINRNTFYTHYSSPQELLIHIENKFFDKIQSSINSEVNCIQDICQRIVENSELCKILFSEYGDKEFLKKLINIAYDKTLTQWKEVLGEGNYNGDELELLYIYSINGSVAILQNWIQGGMVKSPKEIASFIDKVSRYACNPFFNKN
ncbi:TetR/AcrR family transcriptional regulator [Clostridium cylindrosporum]|uniref:TetR family transcriptional regulator n=1 Tax=Clostridium cylindrosporum DSM 605 TaxID=1121307 RepID=A0A0J8D788_CLOCY|nr:TetR-like C-terminal domain-containing protein [Clostridium cylindrosporum]KMT21930.1 TetR family transcriptional regulator [Clostridium cylindrosporum DSM 605]